jgi:2',3'-cyclic-nucleotide 2'-phosphodiesterase (5'-nucleotidase family)
MSSARLFPVLICALAASQASARADENNPAAGAYLPAQAAADVLRDFAKADGAFLAADQVKTTYVKTNLASLLSYPTYKLVIVSMTGAQAKTAFERSVSLFPQDNASFLQISGFEVTFNKSAPPWSRIVKATLNGSALDDKKTYTVAMPDELANGVLGYFKVWDKGQITKSFDSTLESILSKKAYVVTTARWTAE